MFLCTKDVCALTGTSNVQCRWHAAGVRRGPCVRRMGPKDEKVWGFVQNYLVVQRIKIKATFFQNYVDVSGRCSFTFSLPPREESDKVDDLSAPVTVHLDCTSFYSIESHRFSVS